jgi:hypothetical protein
VQRWSSDLDGVFTISDLKVALDTNSEATFYRVVEEMAEREMLIKVKRGLYATPQAKLTDISNRIDPTAYISTGTVLAKSGTIGSIPARRVQAVKVGRPRTYRCKIGVIEHLSICPNLYFGFSKINGLLVSSLEKAFLDVCYFNFRGKRFSFDPQIDVNIEDFDFDLIERYLGKYDSRFVTYFNRIWREQ